MHLLDINCVLGPPVTLHSEPSINITGVGVVPGTLSPHPGPAQIGGKACVYSTGEHTGFSATSGDETQGLWA